MKRKTNIKENKEKFDQKKKENKENKIILLGSKEQRKNENFFMESD